MVLGKFRTGTMGTCERFTRSYIWPSRAQGNGSSLDALSPSFRDRLTARVPGRVLLEQAISYAISVVARTKIQAAGHGHEAGCVVEAGELLGVVSHKAGVVWITVASRTIELSREVQEVKNSREVHGLVIK